jgi:hypothetical protein
LLALDPFSDFLMIDRGGPDNLEEAAIAEKVVVEV